MRTYYFAAESSESMERWMYNMNLASLLQRDFAPGAVSEGASWDERQSGRPSVSSFSSLLNQSADDSDSGFHGGRSPKHATIAVGSANSGQPAVVPMWATKGKKLEEETLSEVSRERDAVVNYRKGAETTPEVPSLPAEFQPLYANAPPKPRRLNSGGRDYSTSPERSPDRKAAEDGVVLRSKVPAKETQQNGMYVDRNQRTSRPTVSYASIRHERNSSYQQQNMQVQQQPIGIPAPNQVGIPMVDRRTPDTYGRSNTAETSTTAGIPKMVPNKVDYEDVYSVNQTSDQVIGRMNRWSSGPYEAQHFYPTEIHHNTMPQQAPHMHLFPPSGHSPQQGLQQHTHSTPLGVVQRMPISHPYSVSPTTAQHQHPPLPQAQPQPHVNQQLMPPQPQPQMLHRRTPPLPRPHSADFLGHYDHNQMSYVMPLPANRTTPIEHPSPKISTAAEESQKPYKNVPSVEMREHRVTDVVPAQQIQRPKSSMDIRPMSQTLSFDPVDYWSEESYARMMRQSLYMHAHHVHPSSSSSHKGSETSSGMGHQQLQNWPPYMQEASPALTHQSAPRIPQISPKPQTIDPPSPYKGTEDMAATIPLRQSAPPGKKDLNQGGYFLRSASARMPRSRYHSGDSQRDQPNVLSTIPGEEEKNGEKKMQQVMILKLISFSCLM
ncbi:hypothetical protein J437_LFUL005537 [Ladona fulva]|uniref:PH domain-containing protein n=1 Tax=Ladona fulva TaxID=123851 RepID=A0A8K0JXE0_LADFU|nr:hypothetical protein J437_LFUL005537 [Ladona fulva]